MTSPFDGEAVGPWFPEGGPEEVRAALAAAVEGADALANAQRRAALLEAVADALEEAGDPLLEHARLETGLGLARLEGERARTCGQLRMFADLVREGSWVEARIDRGDPARKPHPKPELRRMLRPLGPVVVFGASNFPLAYSVVGGDTASAWAAGNPVVFKAHPAHAGTCEMTAEAVRRAVVATGLPSGVFSMIHGAGPEVGRGLVVHPSTRAGGFTGSLAGGKALHAAASTRAAPIPFFAEMGSLNPVCLLAGALDERLDEIAARLAASITLGEGQFCTKPGLIFGVAGSGWERFQESLASRVAEVTGGVMLHAGIHADYVQEMAEVTAWHGVHVLARGKPGAGPCASQPVVGVVEGSTFRQHPRLAEEMFGPFGLCVTAKDMTEMGSLLAGLGGQLTATVHVGPGDDASVRGLLPVLENLAGRVIWNGVPTGVEVAPAMTHGGPWPATTDARHTSVGSASITRWARPVTWQDTPAGWLPEELHDGNPRGILRLVDGVPTREPLAGNPA